MADKKTLNMGKPKTPRKGMSTGKLMDSQDTITKGDGVMIPTVPTTVRIPIDLKRAVQDRAHETGRSLTWYVVEGLYMALEK